jgi:hypothetical protein
MPASEKPAQFRTFRKVQPVAFGPDANLAAAKPLLSIATGPRSLSRAKSASEAIRREMRAKSCQGPNDRPYDE